MGLGKSIQAIVAARLLIRSGKLARVLIVCPKSLLTDWEEKLWQWAPELAVVRVDGTPEFRKQVWLANPSHHVRIVTYDTLSRDIDVADKVVFDLCILDEGQRIKNPGTAMSKACKRLQASWRWVLSGTPLENRLDDPISLFEFIKPGLLHESDALRPHYVTAEIAPYVLRRRKSEHAAELNLPEKRHDLRWLELLPRQREAYELMETQRVKWLNEQGDAVTVAHILAVITELKLICNYDKNSGESCKLEFISEQLEKLFEQSPDEKVLIFSQYPNKTLPHVAGALGGWSPLTFDGSLSGRQRDEVRHRFEEAERHKILLLGVKAGGQGLNLQRANHVYHYDLWWNPAVVSQAEDRAHRIGQQRPVFVTSFLVRNTIEERIHQILKRKKRRFDEVFDDLTDTRSAATTSDEDLMSKLTEEELFGLFGLKPPQRKSPAKATDGTAGAVKGVTGLDKITPREFEQLVSQLFQALGYSTRLTRYSQDGGIDIHARRLSEASRENLVIQCKHYPDGTVGVEAARALNGLLTQDFSGGVLVTSGRFSAECKEFCQRTRIHMIDGAELLSLLRKHGCF